MEPFKVLEIRKSVFVWKNRTASFLMQSCIIGKPKKITGFPYKKTPHE